jgi:hypothetical protein
MIGSTLSTETTNSLLRLKIALRRYFEHRNCPVMDHHRERLAEIFGKIPGGAWRDE